MNRRLFIAKGLSGAAAFGAGGAICRAQTALPKTAAAAKAGSPEATGRPHLDPAAVFEFVGAAHSNLDRVKEMLEQESPEQRKLGGLILAERELGLGDLETALGGASHMGRPDIAEYLLSKGARIDAFCAAMLGYREAIQAILKACPRTATTKGPHGYTLLYHAAISGDVAIAEAIKPLLPADAKDYDQALTSAAAKGKLEMTRWLLGNGVKDVNFKTGLGTTALQNAEKNNFPEVAAELRKHGAK